MSIHERFSEQELAILKARAERAASLSDRDAAQTTLTVLQIMLGEETYGLPVNDLRAVYEDVIVVPVPGTPPFVAGIANVRGRILPVLDLPVLLGVPDQAATLGTRALVVANRDAMTVALAIEAVGEIVAVAGQEIVPVPGATNTPQTNYLRGILPGGGGLIDIAALLGDPSLIVAETF